LEEKKDKRGGPKKRERKAGKTNYEKKRRFQREFFLTDQATEPLEDSFIPSMKSENGIFWMVHWWVLGHSSHGVPNYLLLFSHTDKKERFCSKNGVGQGLIYYDMG
jgi:hypothetical protein